MLRRLALLAVLAATVLATAATTASATPVATNDGEYTLFGRVFPDPQAGCTATVCSPNAEGSAAGAATQFIQYPELIDGLKYLNSKPIWQKYMEVLTLDGKLDSTYNNPGANTPEANESASEADLFPGNGGGGTAPPLEFHPNEEAHSAGLPTSLSVIGGRKYSDLIVVRVTDESVPDAGKKRMAVSLSIHGIERAGAEGGTRAIEDLVTAESTDNLDKKALPDGVEANNPTLGDILKKTIIYFSYPNPDGWRRGDVGEGGFFYQRYNGNGVDVNRDWVDIGFAYRPYSTFSERESRYLGAFFTQVRDDFGKFSAGDDLHGQPYADAFSFTLLPHGRHDYAKNVRLQEAAKAINRAQYAVLKWSPVIQANDQPVGGSFGPGCQSTVELGNACPKMYAQTWGTVYDTIDYTTTGALGDWFDSSVGLQADGIDNEMSFSHLDKNIVFDKLTEQMHVDGNKALIYAHLGEILNPPSQKFDTPGLKGFVRNTRVRRADQKFQPLIPPGTHAQTDFSGDGVNTGGQAIVPFTVQRTDTIYNGGMQINASAPNVNGVGTGTLKMTIQCMNCQDHPGEDPDSDGWIDVTSDYNQLILYGQAGATATVNRPQAFGRDGQPTQWRAVFTGDYLVLNGPGVTPVVHVDVHFSQDPATATGETGGGLPPATRAYDVANTDYFDDLNKYVPEGKGFEAVDPHAVIAGNQSLAKFTSLVLADNPLPGFTGGFQGQPTGPPTADLDISQANSPTTPGQGANGCDRTNAHADYHPFTIGSNDADAALHVLVEWASNATDWDVYVQRKGSGDEWVDQGSPGTNSATTSEEVNIEHPAPGDWRVQVLNCSATVDKSYTGSVKFTAFPTASTTGGGSYTLADRDAWIAKLKEFADNGGNLVLTDGALVALPELTGIPSDSVSQQTVYVGQNTFDKSADAGDETTGDVLARDVAQPGSRFNTGLRRQMYEPTPLGFSIQDKDTGADQSHARNFQVARKAFESLGGRVVGTSADSATRPSTKAVYDQVTLGEIPFGKGDIRVEGALLPQPTEAFDHDFGLEPYSVTTSGYIVMRNLLDGAPRSAEAAAAPPAKKATVCATAAGFKSVSAKASKRGLKVGFRKRVGKGIATKIAVDVFQTSQGRKIVRERRVAKFRNRAKSFKWNGRGAKGKRLSNGYYFVRYRIKTPEGVDTRRITMRRSKGRFTKRPPHYRRASCDVLRAFKLERPAFGGSNRKRLRGSYRLGAAASVTVRITRGKKVVKKYKTVARKAGKTYRFSRPLKGMRVGDYKVRLTIVAGKRTLRSSLTSRRI